MNDAEPVSTGITNCPLCGASQPPGAAFCDECGARLAEVAPAATPTHVPPDSGECPVCGYLNPDRSAFCDNCGAALVPSPSARIRATARRRLSLLSDSPARKDALDYHAYRDALVAIIRDLAPESPLTIGVFGDWGSGKSTLLRMTSDELSKPSDSSLRPIPVVWLDVWQLSNEEQLRNAFLQALLSKLKAEMRFFRRLILNARLVWRRVDWSKAPGQMLRYGYRALVAIAPLVVARLIATAGNPATATAATLGGGLTSAALGLWLIVQPFFDAIRENVTVDLAGLLKDSPLEERVTALDRFKDHFDDMVKWLAGQKGRLAIVIDDLDRCPPDRMVQVLDALKLFVDSPRCVYLLGVDRGIVEQAVRCKYAGYADPVQEARDYIEKIIQLAFDLPPLTSESMEALIEGLDPQLPDSRCDKVFALGLQPNPRKVKRSINTFLLLWQLAQHREELRRGIAPVRLAKVVVIQQSHRDLFDDLVNWPADLGVLEAHFRNQAKLLSGVARLETDAEGHIPGGKQETVLAVPGVKDHGEGQMVGLQELKETELPQRLIAFSNHSLLRKLLTLNDPEKEANTTFVTVKDGQFVALGGGQVLPYITLTRTVTVEESQSASSFTAAPIPGDVLQGRYRIVGQEAQTGLATIYKAVDIKLGGLVRALKRISLFDPDFRLHDFESRALIAAQLDHTGIERTFDVFYDNGDLYEVVEYVEGKSLDEILKQAAGPLPVDEVLDWADQMCDVLQYLHDQDPPVIHRDVKPRNLMLQPNGQLKLVDFDIARTYKPGKARDTDTWGTPGYAAPEQHGTAQTDARSDIYSLGATLYHLLTNQDPTEVSLSFAPIRQFNPAVSEKVDRAIMKALQHNPEDRYQSGSEFKAALLGNKRDSE